MRFFVPTELVLGKGCVRQSAEKLRRLGSRCLVVTGAQSAEKCGALGDALAALENVGVSYTVYNGIRQNPTVQSCREGAQDVDFVLGIGGGSPLDAAKAVAVFAANPGLTEEDLYAYRWKNDPLPIVCIGTTAGTGSEVTPVAVLTDCAGEKRSIRDDRIFPTLSLGDPAYTAFLEEKFTRSCAVDAAAHCIESFFGKQANEFSRMFAVQGAAKLADVFRRTGCVGLSRTDRERLYLASICGGYAISVTGTAFPHAMGYFLSERHGVPHGTACGVFLPAFLEHADRSDAKLVEDFCTQTNCGKAEWITLLRKVMPACNAKVSAQEIASMRRRFEGNSGLARSIGTFTAGDALGLLSEIFL